MQLKSFFTALALVLTTTGSFAQPGIKDYSKNRTSGSERGDLSIQPGVGMRFKFGNDLLLTNLVIANPLKHLSIAAHTSVSYNNLFQRNFNYIKTNYDYSVSQTLGVGTTLSGRRASHSFLFMAGVKYDNFKETLENPEFDKVSTSVSALNPDLGFRYNFAYGTKKYFFHTGLYIPLYPYPFKTANIQALDGNMKNISLELGLGIRI